MNNFKVSVLITVVLFLGLTTWILLSQSKQGYVDTNVLYSEFIMTKELDSDYVKITSARNSSIDSLKTELQSMSSDLKINKALESVFIKKRENFIKLAEKFKEDNQMLNTQYISKIWTRINQYVKKYGEENGYDFIHGASGQGNLLYANDKKNITKEVVEYINNSYLGSK